ncbi:hypothetical protein LEP1GSC008_4520 [Leptospira kirschneri serovar Bulgarica str. Nikolaevo]|uniref:Uncharacterized protein n=2 Tax=Leptospira kirschneri TaxID=29507 RepID=A0A0E2AZ12_9LEPT|nr:hypothetical protein LEP1GSC081_2037 [Leptospira kirschneri str. H1]EMK25231.1 hypothetical protein LEP1GSC008_4520 [Leptospira kirschneri serovar Bulgarica str. Nikolaevo]
MLSVDSKILKNIKQFQSNKIRYFASEKTLNHIKYFSILKSKNKLSILL